MPVTVYTTSTLAGTGYDKVSDRNRRGLNVYTMTELVGISGRDKEGEQIQGLIEQALFGLSVIDRISIFQRCDLVFGAITSRMNRIAALDWQVIKETKETDRKYDQLKQAKQLFDEYSEEQSVRAAIIRGRLIRLIKIELPDCFDDLSNFNASVMRWNKRIKQDCEDRSTEIEDWLNEPNIEDDFEDFVKKWVQDLMVHGCAGHYKEYIDGRLENLYILPGGTVCPLRTKYVGGGRAFAQIVPGEDPMIYHTDEIIYSSYVPSSALSYGMIPLEALVNKVAESLFFDVRAAEQADGTKPPEKLIIMGESAPFGDLTNREDLQLPLDKAEQARIEEALSTPRKEAFKVVSGIGTPVVVDISRADTFAQQSERQRILRETVAFVFNMSNMEVNLSGSDDTSGRETSEQQAEIEQAKGVAPIIRIIENKINRDILPYRFGSGYHFEYKPGISPEKTLAQEIQKMQTKTYTVNEIRTARGDEPFNDPKYDRPDEQGMTAPDGTQGNPMNVQMKR